MKTAMRQAFEDIEVGKRVPPLARTILHTMERADKRTHERKQSRKQGALPQVRKQ